MGDVKNNHPVLSRIRHNGKVYLAGCEGGIDLTEKQAAPLLKVKAIGPADGEAYDPNAPLVPNLKAEFDLVKTITDLIADGNDIKAMNMADIGKLLGANSRGVKRADIDAALVKIDTLAAGAT